MVKDTVEVKQAKAAYRAALRSLIAIDEQVNKYKRRQIAARMHYNDMCEQLADLGVNPDDVA